MSKNIIMERRPTPLEIIRNMRDKGFREEIIIEELEKELTRIDADQLNRNKLIKVGYEWWEYLISKKENDRLIKKYYPDETTGYPRFFMDTDKARIYCLENGINVPDFLEW